jgi:hypothetical protein
MDAGEFKSTIRSSILILLFELIGTLCLTLLFICHSGVSIDYFGKNMDYIFTKDSK